MDALLKRLHEASNDGEINKLKQLLEEDPLLLDKVLTEVRDNPLHIAALQGHVDFIREVIRLKPELAHQFNREGRLPLHLAAARGHLQVADILVDKVGNDICLIRESNHGYLPVHIATINGKYDVVKMLVERCRETLEIVTNKMETLLHLAVMANCLECVRYLFDQHVNINKEDEDGNTCLHLAAAKRNRQVVTDLLKTQGIKVNSTNAKGLTPLDVLLVSSLGSAVDISLVKTFKRANGVESTELSDLESNTHSSIVVGSPPPSNQRLSTGNRDNTREKKSDAQTLLIVATLVATMTFQAITNPPGGFIQPQIEKNDTLSGLLTNNSISWYENWRNDFLFPAGRPVLLWQLDAFFILDSLALYSSVSVILWLLIAEPETKIVMNFLVAIVWFAAFCTALAFGSAFLAIYGRSDLGINFDSYVQRFMWVWGLLLAWFFVYVIAGIWATVVVIRFLWTIAGFKMKLLSRIVSWLKDSKLFQMIIAIVHWLKGSSLLRKIICGILMVCAVGTFVLATGGVFLLVSYCVSGPW